MFAEPELGTYLIFVNTLRVMLFYRCVASHHGVFTTFLPASSPFCVTHNPFSQTHHKKIVPVRNV